MEFNERLLELRKQRGLTQEELAASLFVSRTAVSKWESGRGYPNIDSLKAIARFFSVTIDELLSSGEALTLAQDEQRRRAADACNLALGLLDCGNIALLFLPFFGYAADGGVRAVSLLQFTGAQPYLHLVYVALVIGMTLPGILMLALRTWDHALWVGGRRLLSFALHAAGTFAFIAGRQPYAAAFALMFLLIKAFMCMNWQ